VITLYSNLRAVLSASTENSVDAVCTKLQHTPGLDCWKTILRICKPGANMLVFGGPLNHRLTCAVEDAGWEIRDTLMWREPIILAMKPLDGTIAHNAEKWGVAGFNIDACRIGPCPGYKYNANKNGTIFHGEQGKRIKRTAAKAGSATIESTKGRWPANVLIDEKRAAILGDRKKFFHVAKDENAVIDYLLRLLSTPTGGVILDPFADNGAVIRAARRLGRDCIGILTNRI
jgi:DNA modification methylase